MASEKELMTEWPDTLIYTRQLLDEHFGREYITVVKSIYSGLNIICIYNQVHIPKFSKLADSAVKNWESYDC